jgi:hypothetical protein
MLSFFATIVLIVLLVQALGLEDDQRFMNAFFEQEDDHDRQTD